MEENPAVRYFLGANTATGFTSLYDEFTNEQRADRVWYIKGGPGNGKSTFMKRVAQAAAEKGEAVEYAMCSGDPDSLDGVFLPGLRTVYVDATAPHVQEPSLPGVVGCYIDLSVFYKRSAHLDRDAICQLYGLYREQYARAYDLLHAASLCAPGKIPGLIVNDTRLAVGALAQELTEKLSRGGGKTRRLFLSAYTGKGKLLFPELLHSCRQIIALHSAAGLESLALREIEEICRGKNMDRILCPDPLLPEKLEGIVLPEAGVAFYRQSRGEKLPGAEHVYLDKTIDGEIWKQYAEERQRSAAASASLLRQACASLCRAKEYHDALEAQYHAAVDFSALDRFTQKHIKENINKFI